MKLSLSAGGLTLHHNKTIFYSVLSQTSLFCVRYFCLPADVLVRHRHYHSLRLAVTSPASQDPSSETSARALTRRQKLATHWFLVSFLTSICVRFTSPSRKFGSSPPPPVSSSFQDESNEPRIVAVGRCTRPHAPEEDRCPILLVCFPEVSAAVGSVDRRTLQILPRVNHSNNNRLAQESETDPTRTNRSGPFDNPDPTRPDSLDSDQLVLPDPVRWT
ncbi:hypothetical protein PIB30_015356 [Stylosanthes scabra]|uniref:Uncharacterized protein n=1 Tax=Stylosanthes scabra TaxID=79078 RepID=A0ABU6R7A1_9FABA|nr:hypothetical protein [Stylosanthes scabra]